MRPIYLVLGLVATVHALPSIRTAPTLLESLFTRDDSKKKKDDGPQQVYFCPKSTSQSPDAITKAPINTTQLAFAEQQLMTFCDSGTTVPPSSGGNGHVENYGNASIQFCNQIQTPINCNSSTIRFVIDGIKCGTFQSPIEGYGQVKDNSKAKNPEQWYVFYSQRGSNVSNCLSVDDLKGVPREKNQS